jgi:hypothetical protein
VLRNELPIILEVVSENTNEYRSDVNEGDQSSKKVHSSLSSGPHKFPNSSAEGSAPPKSLENISESLNETSR